MGGKAGERELLDNKIMLFVIVTPPKPDYHPIWKLCILNLTLFPIKSHFIVKDESDTARRIFNRENIVGIISGYGWLKSVVVSIISPFPLNLNSLEDPHDGNISALLVHILNLGDLGQVDSFGQFWQPAQVGLIELMNLVGILLPWHRRSNHRVSLNHTLLLALGADDNIHQLLLKIFHGCLVIHCFNLICMFEPRNIKYKFR